MKYLTLFIGLLLLVGLLTGCTKPNVINEDTEDTSSPPSTEDVSHKTAEDTPPETSENQEVMKEIEDTFVEDKDLEVGELY